MKRSKLSLGLLLIGGLALAGCSNNQKTSDVSTSNVSPSVESSTSVQSSTEEKDINYTLKVYDLDGTELLNKSLKTKKKDSLFVDLNRESTLDADASDLGHYINSINNSIIDQNYFLAIYQNGKMTSTGIDGVVLADGDEIVIRNECWAQFDETDKLVDKAFYQYIKNYLIEDIKDDSVQDLWTDADHCFSNYWTYVALGVLKDNGYNIDIKSENTALYNAIKDFDLTKLTKTAYGKYYYYAKAFGVNLDSFKTQYESFIENSLETEYTPGYSQEYSIPFEIAPAKSLNITSDKITALVNTDYVPPFTTEWSGVTYSNYDGYNWFQTINLLFGKEKNETTLTAISQLDYSNETPTTVALSIATFAASNENVRKSEYEQNEKDLVELLLESYDSNLGLIKVFSTDEGINYSTNQIYASLFAYKFQRDSTVKYIPDPKAVNIFA